MLAVVLSTVLNASPLERAERLEAWAWQDAAQAPQVTAPPKTDDEKHAQDIKNDVEMGKKYSAEADKELKPSQDAAMTERVQKIGAKFAAIANSTPVISIWGDGRLNRFEYTFKVVEGKDVNAFSLPGGFIYVFEGLVKYVETDDELAGVIAHEVAHASLRHVATLQREQRKVQSVQLPLILLSILTGGAAGAAAALNVGNLVGTALGSGWSVQAEKAADYAGFQYMLQSDYEPGGILTMMERLARDERSKPDIDWGIYRTHPPGRDRATSLSRYLADAKVQVKRSVTTTSYRMTAKPGDKGTVDLWFGTRKLVSLAGEGASERAESAVPKLNAYFDAIPSINSIKVGPDGNIVGNKGVLLEITPEDAAAANTSLPSLRQKTVEQMRLYLYTLTLDIWDGR